MKLIVNFYFFCIFFILFGLKIVAQTGCVSTNSEVSLQGFVCSDQLIGGDSYVGKKFKIGFNYTDVLNIHTFSTVGESNDDTELYLYDGDSNTVLAYNDDDSNCGGCKQSTLIYNEPTSNHKILYVVVAKKGCNNLTNPTKVKFSARNPYNMDPRILTPTSIIQCVGNLATFTYDPSTTTIPTPWLSLTPDVVTIDEKTGIANFISPGIAKIQLQGNSSCIIINNYIVNGMKTSTINPEN